jgi:predicted ribonuclease YlaK
LDSSIGNILVSKLGDRVYVERLIEDGTLLLLPFSDLRGFDTNGMKACIYITEAQNLDKYLIKLALQRIGEDCSAIIEGDDQGQVDLSLYSGTNNGMKRAIEVFKGQDIFGTVQLKNIYRSKIAKIADNI